MFRLTRENYYTPEADWEYMSCSQYQSFLECEAATVARLSGRYVSNEKPEALLVGNYVHSYLESPEAHQEFIKENFGDIYKTKVDKKTGDVIITGKYAPFERADKMIDTLISDEVIKSFIDMNGENECIMTGEIFGMPWRIRIDKYIPERNLIIDYKTCADFYKTDYNEQTRQRESFVEAYGYLMRAAVYSEIEMQNTGKDIPANFMLICVSKQDIPDKELLLLNNPERYELELENIKRNLIRIKRVKEGSVYPRRCGRCEYCRATKKLRGVKPYYVLTPGFEGEPEEDEYRACKPENMEIQQVSGQ